MSGPVLARQNLRSFERPESRRAYAVGHERTRVESMAEVWREVWRGTGITAKL
jgi:hypothetical protein